MRIRYLLALALLATVANAKEPKHYQSGKLIKMQSVKCGTDAKDAKSLAGEMLGTDFSAHENPRIALSGIHAAEQQRDVHHTPKG